tara:strand:+ start:430 stop:537 length:108 start_codon:yes stop_codon:yes gene_type:complete
MRSLLVEILAYEARKIRLWKWAAIISISLHILRSF